MINSKLGNENKELIKLVDSPQLKNLINLNKRKYKWLIRESVHSTSVLAIPIGNQWVSCVSFHGRKSKNRLMELGLFLLTIIVSTDVW